MWKSYFLLPDSEVIVDDFLCVVAVAAVEGDLFPPFFYSIKTFIVATGVICETALDTVFLHIILHYYKLVVVASLLLEAPEKIA